MPETESRPNLFIVGAPKCGTTSLCYYLGQHQDVFVSTPKEPFYFGKDFSKPQKDIGDYLKLFESGKNQAYRCEGSTWYLFSRSTAQEIHDFNAAGKIVIMVRNPIEVLQSLIEQRIYDRTESVTTLEAALALESQRVKGEQLPKSRWHLPKEKYYYSQVPLFAEQIARYMEVFGKENVWVIKFDAFKANPLMALRELETFLGLKPFPDYDLTIRNQRKTLRNPGLKDFLTQLPGPLRKVAHLITAQSLRRNIFQKIDSMNQSKATPRRIDDALRHRLVDQYKDQELKLEKLLGVSFKDFVK